MTEPLTPEVFRALCLEEYKALRAESLRSMTLISSTIWIGLSGFVLTLAATAAVLKLYPPVLSLAILLLAVQSIAATTMLLAEVRKYVRVGTYIRDKIERAFIPQPSADLCQIPMYWEHWLSTRRTKLFYAVSLLFLQLPMIGVLLLELEPLNLLLLRSAAISTVWQHLDEGPMFHIGALALLVLDSVVVAMMVAQILRQNKKTPSALPPAPPLIAIEAPEVSLSKHGA